MTDYETAIDAHYGSLDLSGRILDALAKAGKKLDALTRDDLVSFDEHHGGGREATRELATLTGLTEKMRVLDIGSGVGGPARTLAAEFGCNVTGLELTKEYCDAATMLTRRVRLDALVKFQQENALDMPFDDASFDAVWAQDVLMNIEDKASLFGEIYRVLPPGGSFAFQASMKGAVSGLHFPTFWADDESLSFLVPLPELRQQLEAAGFKIHEWHDTTAQAVEQARHRMMVGSEEHGNDMPATLGLGVIVPRDLEARATCMMRNFSDNRLAKIMAVCRA